VRDRNFMWLKYVKHILCNCGFNYIWESQTFINELWLKHSIKQNLTDQYLPLISLAQKDIVLTFISMSRGYLPSSP
jgi:hypothetical protein